MRSARTTVCRTLHSPEGLLPGFRCARAWHPRCNPKRGMQITLSRLDASLPGRPVLALVAGSDPRGGARVAARVAVACAVGLPLASIGIQHRDGEAPEVSLPAGAEPFRVSVSHHGPHAVAAAVPARIHVGVDLEREGAVRPGSARHFLDRREHEEGRHGHDLTSLWMLKEAAWKALGLDPATPFHALRLRFGDDAELCGLEIPSRGRAYRARAVLREVAASVWLAVIVATPGEA